jgi:large subunit ribosomal protein L18
MNKKGFIQRRKRVRSKISGTADRPRLSVFRSNRGIYAQIINDESGKTLVSISTKDDKIQGSGTKTEKASLAGETLGKLAVKAKIEKVVFDKSGYRYHGRIKAFADGARKGGLEF